MPSLLIRSREELSHHHLEVLTAARRTNANLQRLLTVHHGIDLLHELRFALSAFSPIYSPEPYNVVEAINQSFTALVSFAGAECILQLHPNSLPLRLNVGAMPGFDIQDHNSSIVAECFAAVTPDNNNKLTGDFAKLEGSDAEHKYLFFYSPAIEFRVPSPNRMISVTQLTLDQLYHPNTN